MYSLLIKDRAYPISVYLSYMMRVKGFTRTQAVELMTQAAFNMNRREDITPPANNTVAEWGKSTETPLWAVISAMTLLEQFGKVPYLDQEWAFWAYATVENSPVKKVYSGKWEQWLNKARLYKSWVERRGNLRGELQDIFWPNIGAKIIILAKGNNSEVLSLPEIFFDQDVSLAAIQLLTDKICSGQTLTMSHVRSVTASQPDSAALLENIMTTIQQLIARNVAIHHFNGNIKIL
ncbi:TPA: hypothetical protein JD192_13275 [Cronobacter sakazakii]|nr:hypothetical protein [Cronobacter sakazakii]